MFYRKVEHPRMGEILGRCFICLIILLCHAVGGGPPSKAPNSLIFFYSPFLYGSIFVRLCVRLWLVYCLRLDLSDCNGRMDEARLFGGMVTATFLLSCYNQSGFCSCRYAYFTNALFPSITYTVGLSALWVVIDGRTLLR